MGEKGGENRCGEFVIVPLLHCAGVFSSYY